MKSRLFKMTTSSSSKADDEIERHRAAVTRYLRHLIRDATEAEDLAQETFLRAYRRRQALRDTGALESWLYQIATHVSIDRMRQRARLAANDAAKALPSCARACHAETFFVPHSSMARWVKQADRAVMIDGCFLKCHGRVLNRLVSEERMIHIDALPLYRKYTDIFSMDEVPERERKAVARQITTVVKQQVPVTA